MKKYKSFFLFIITLMVTCTIIYVGYRALDVAGNYFIISDNKIKTYPIENGDFYVFYSQSDSELTLFPWNYYDSAISLKDSGSTTGDMSTRLTTPLKYIDYDIMYSTLIFYFYKTIPDYVRTEILAADSSLAEIMGFPNGFISKLKAKTVANINYYFYDEILTINGVNYKLSFSFNDYFSLCSFQCRQIVDEGMYSRDNMRLGNEYLSNFIHYREQQYLNLLLLDIFMYDSYLENYAINYVDANNISLNFHGEHEKLYLFSVNSDYSELFSDETKQITNSSYQIVETKDELLLILADNNIVLHFDPISRIFTGFNQMG